MPFQAIKTSSPKRDALLAKIAREWDLEAGAFEGGPFADLRNQATAFQMYAAVFAMFGGMLVFLEFQSGRDLWFAPDWRWVAAAALFSGPGLMELSLHDKADKILRLYGVLPNVGPEKGLSEPSIPHLQLLLAGLVASRLVNLTIHVIAGVGVAGSLAYGIYELLTNGSIRQLLGVIVVLLVVVVVQLSRRRQP